MLAAPIQYVFHYIDSKSMSSEHDLRYMYYVYINIFSYKCAFRYADDHFCGVGVSFGHLFCVGVT